MNEWVNRMGDAAEWCCSNDDVSGTQTSWADAVSWRDLSCCQVLDLHLCNRSADRNHSV